MSIVDRQGAELHLGDHVKTEAGEVLVVRGLLVNQKLFVASTVTKVDPSTPLKHEKADGDNIVWGT
jgi:hypothetical protein